MKLSHRFYGLVVHYVSFVILCQDPGDEAMQEQTKKRTVAQEARLKVQMKELAALTITDLVLRIQYEFVPPLRLIENQILVTFMMRFVRSLFAEGEYDSIPLLLLRINDNSKIYLG